MKRGAPQGGTRQQFSPQPGSVQYQQHLMYQSSRPPSSEPGQEMMMKQQQPNGAINRTGKCAAITIHHVLLWL